MELAAITSFLFLGLGLGMLHAFDPDHVAAVGGLSAAHPKQGTWVFSLHWSLGHGTALIIVAMLVFIVGTAVPSTLSALAEKSVGLVLVGIGVLAMYRIIRSRLFPLQQPTKERAVAAPVVGLLHGTAGSAPLLALIPLAQLSQPAVGVLYVVCFSLGVMMAMTALGACIACGLRRLNQGDALWLSLIQGLLAAFSLVFGLYLLILQA